MTLLALALTVVLGQIPADLPPPPPPPPAVDAASYPPLPPTPPPPPPGSPGDEGSAPGPAVTPSGGPPVVGAPVLRPPGLVPPAEPTRPARGAVYFAPVSLFGLFLSVEVEWAFAERVTGYATVGGGLLGVVAGELGGRFYVMERALDGLYVEGHGQLFAAPGDGLVLTGPGVMLGWNLRGRGVSRMITSLGLGVNVWFESSSPSATFLGSRPSQSSFIVLPGLQVPPFGSGAPQLTIRLNLGPSF